MKISQTVCNLHNGHEYMVEMAMFNIQKGNNSKNRQSELWRGDEYMV